MTDLFFTVSGAQLVAASTISQVRFAEFKETADNRANIGGAIISAPIIGQ